MAKGARLFPLQVTRLYERMVAVVDRKRKEPTKMYYKTKKGRHFIERYTPEQINAFMLCKTFHEVFESHFIILSL